VGAGNSGRLFGDSGDSGGKDIVRVGRRGSTSLRKALALDDAEKLLLLLCLLVHTHTDNGIALGDPRAVPNACVGDLDAVFLDPSRLVGWSHSFD
jgi:hypothetical protein